jgi:hypothetical protein
MGVDLLYNLLGELATPNIFNCMEAYTSFVREELCLRVWFIMGSSDSAYCLIGELAAPHIVLSGIDLSKWYTVRTAEALNYSP